jgi:hypothetical protein
VSERSPDLLFAVTICLRLSELSYPTGCFWAQYLSNLACIAVADPAVGSVLSFAIIDRFIPSLQSIL